MEAIANVYIDRPHHCSYKSAISDLADLELVQAIIDSIRAELEIKGKAAIAAATDTD